LSIRKLGKPLFDSILQKKMMKYFYTLFYLLERAPTNLGEKYYFQNKKQNYKASILPLEVIL